MLCGKYITVSKEELLKREERERDTKEREEKKATEEVKAAKRPGGSGLNPTTHHASRSATHPAAYTAWFAAYEFHRRRFVAFCKTKCAVSEPGEKSSVESFR
jgi:hypothetical protein